MGGRWLAWVGACTVGAGALALAGVPWQRSAWTPDKGLQVGVAEFTATQVDVLTALMILDNECGLVFGYADPWVPVEPSPTFDLSVRDATVEEIVERIKAAAPGFDFAMLDGVVTVGRLSAKGERPAFLKTVVPRFEVVEAPPSELKDKVTAEVFRVPGLPTLYSSGRGEPKEPKTTLQLADVALETLLARAAAALGESWVLRVGRSGDAASFNMGRGWGLSRGVHYAVRLAEGAPKEPIPGELPPPDVVQERVASAVRDGRLALRDLDEVVAELADLVDSPWVRDNAAPGGIPDAIQLLGDSRAVEAAPVLARNAGFSGTAAATYELWLKSALASRPAGEAAPPQEVVYLFWLQEFPCLPALEKIGLPAVPAIVGELSTTQIAPAPGAVEMVTAPQERESKVIILCEALQRILGKEAAVLRLEQEAAARKDEAEAARLREAAARITAGLSAFLDE